MSRAVGVDLGPARATVLQIERSGKETRIVQFLEAPVPPGEGPWEERASATLKRLLDEGRVPRGRLAAALDSGEAILRDVVLPFKNEDQVRKTVRFELESLIHNHAVEDLVVCHAKTGETEKSTMLIAAAAPKTAVAARLKLLQAAGADPAALDLDIAAVFSAAVHAGESDPKLPHLLVYGTPRFAKIAFIEGGRPQSIRTLRFSLEEGDAGPAAAGPEPIVVADEGAPAAGPRVALLAREISRFLLASAATATPSHLLLGGELAGPGVAEELQAASGIPVRTLDVVKGQASVPPAAVPRAAAALGLALKAAGIDPLGMDFRQDEFRYARKFEAVRSTALVALELLVVLLAAVGLHFYFLDQDLRRDAKTVLEHQRTLYESVSGETLPDATGASDRMRALFRQAQNVQGADVPLKASAREAWRDLAGAMLKFQQKYGDRTLGDAQLYLEIETVDVQQSTMQGNESMTLTLRGKIRNLEFAGLLKQEIRALDLFSSADYVGTLSPLPEGNLYQFTLRAVKGGRQG